MSHWPDEFRRGWQGLSQPPRGLVAAFALTCLAGATLARWGISLIRPDTPFSIYLPAVVLATMFGGLRSGIATTVGGAALGFLVSFDGSPTGAAQLPLFAIFLAIAALILWGIERYRAMVAHYRDMSTRLIEEESYRRLVVDELQHRLRNKVSTIHAVIRQVLRDQPEVWDKIDGRIRALSATDNLIARADEKGCDIRDLLHSELGPYGHVRFTLIGDPLYLPARLAVCLALVFHELATNAAKYGAFSSPQGVLHVSWTVTTGELAMVWDETGGPLVTTVNEAGFGTRLLHSALTSFDGRAELLFLETGFRCAMRCRIPA